MWRFFWKIPSLFLTLTNILILSLKLTTETFLKIFIQSFSIAIIYFCNRDFPLSVLEKDAAKLEENQSDEPVLLAPFCDAYQLTQREREVLSLLLECKTNQDIANELFLSIGTVKHISTIFSLN